MGDVDCPDVDLKRLARVLCLSGYRHGRVIRAEVDMLVHARFPDGSYSCSVAAAPGQVEQG